eukprot:CAMPEP_0177483828 /NCGR_PEP_ID=MMETSP0369-20130122/27695_1 /TAXON_ID=447022 ORGANISM="Scrippsiella hangoei-like, Strain SHHI-4" /NCGR_SAMPLE_ID=MMETSP0369 /ASSEMBLY_ACC=CAM_ASM_000364 /LENGTH=183 /DNA_ID=CAMNT_0018959885 /DNA_START=39 /DNA_END=588 /DNA_ORIENTATION=-
MTPALRALRCVALVGLAREAAALTQQAVGLVGGGARLLGASGADGRAGHLLVELLGKSAAAAAAAASQEPGAGDNATQVSSLPTAPAAAAAAVEPLPAESQSTGGSEVQDSALAGPHSYSSNNDYIGNKGNPLLWTIGTVYGGLSVVAIVLYAVWAHDAPRRHAAGKAAPAGYSTRGGIDVAR